jgi:hypothetical protein
MAEEGRTRAGWLAEKQIADAFVQHKERASSVS